MSQVTFQPGVGVTDPLDSTQNVHHTSTTTSTTQIPPTGSQTGGLPDVVLKDIPILADPKLGGLSLEQLVQALGIEGRQTAVKMGLEGIEAKKVEIKELNDKKMEEIQKQLETLKKKEKMSPFLKAFKWVGLVLGAIASIATVVVGAALIATGVGAVAGGLLVAGGLIGCAMAVNSIVSEATDGKVSISAGVAALAKKMGASDEVAQWIGFGVELGISLVGAGLSLAGGIGAMAGVANVAATTVSKIAVTATTVANIASGAVKIAEGGMSIASSVYDSDIAKAKAELKDLEALVLRIQQAQDMEKDFLESVMERTQQLFDSVMDIVEGNIEAQTAVLTGSPSMA